MESYGVPFFTYRNQVPLQLRQFYKRNQILIVKMMDPEPYLVEYRGRQIGPLPKSIFPKDPARWIYRSCWN